MGPGHEGSQTEWPGKHPQRLTGHSMLDSQRLDALLDALQRERFGVGVRERFAAHALITALVSQGVTPVADERTRAMLSSLLTRSAAEANRFKELFAASFPAVETLDHGHIEQ